MSGEKETDYVVDEERLRRIREEETRRERIRQENAERKKLIGDIKQQKTSLSSIANKLTELLQSTPQGIKDSFGSAVNNAEVWIQDSKKSVMYSEVDIPNTSLRTRLNYLNSIRTDGQELMKNLTINFTKDADSIEKSLREELLNLNNHFADNRDNLTLWSGNETTNKITKKLSDINRFIKEKRFPDATNMKKDLTHNLQSQTEYTKKCVTLFNQYEQDKELINHWFEEEIPDIESKFSIIKQALSDEKYGDIEAHLTETQKNIVDKTAEAKELDEKNQKRDYVFASLKAVCNSMGFDTVKETVEGKGPSNRIIYIVDTFSQGKIKFYLGLDNIKADSGIVEDHCMSEFDKVSESLKKNFGVKTRFRMLHEHSAPLKKRLDEIGGSGYDKVINAER